MSNIINISEATSLAIHAAILMAKKDDLVQVREIADFFQVSQAHLSKVLQRLVKCGLVKAHRGRSGGYTLAKNGNEISLLDLYQAIEGPLNMDNCVLSPGKRRVDCPLGKYFEKVNELTIQYFQDLNLDEFIKKSDCPRLNEV